MTACARCTWIPLVAVLTASACGERTADKPALAATERPEGHERMLAVLHALAESAPEEHAWFGSKKPRRLRRKLAGLKQDAPALQRWNVRSKLGSEELRLGNERDAIGHLTAAYDLLPAVAAQIGRESAEQAVLDLAVAHMRLATTRNDCRRHTGESSIMPIRGSGVHVEQEGARTAIAYLRKLLDDPDTTPINALTARWLLNLAYMSLGQYPDQVPAAHLVPPASFESKIPLPRFENVLPRLGLDTFTTAGGTIVDDFDGDGYLDIVTSTWDTADHLRFFRNGGDGSFADHSEAAGLTGFYGGLNMVQADYDNDGDMDILVLRGSWLGEDGQKHPNSLLQNDGSGRFTDVTFEAGLGEPAYPSKTAAWSDYDNDGDLDLYVGNESSVAGQDLSLYTGSDAGTFKAPSQLFRNEGDGTFTDVSSAAGLDEELFAMGAVWGDYDGDRFPDLYVSILGPNRLYHNNGDGTFTDVAEEAGVTNPLGSFAPWFWDYDNDGALDLYVCASSGPVALLALFPFGVRVSSADPGTLRFQEWVRSWVQLPCLYRGDGEGGFEELAEDLGLTYPTLAMGANFGDLDNDGYPDFHIGTGGFQYSELRPNLMFLNRPGRGFFNVTMAGGFGHLQKGHGVAFADLDNDGDQDVYVEMGGAVPGDKFNDVLFENPGFGNRWITVQLVGVRSNRSGLGARLRAVVEIDGESRSIYKHVVSGGSFGCSPMRQTLGLGRSGPVIHTLEVYWPTTDRTQRFTDVDADQAIRIVEGERTYTRLQLARTRLGG